MLLAAPSQQAFGSDGSEEPPTVGVIGDSLTYQGAVGPIDIAQRIVARGYLPQNVRVDGLRGRTLTGSDPAPSSLDVIRSWRAGGFDPHIFVVALGTNDKDASPGFWREQVGKVLAEIGPGHDVHWVGMGFRNPDDPRVASFTETVSPIDGLTFHDWNAYIRTQPQEGIWLPTDVQGVHMVPAGYAIRNPWIAALVPEVSATQP
jgi:hypothetical protein